MERNSRTTRSIYDNDRSTRDNGRGSSRDEGRSSRSDARGLSRSEGGRGSERGSQRSFEYHPPTAEVIKKRADQRGGNDFDSIFKSSTKVFKVRDDSNLIRILPPTWEDPKHFGYDIFVHYGIGADNQTYLCLKEMLGKPCPICEEKQKALKDHDDEYVKELSAKKRVVYGLIDRDEEKEGVQLWAAPWTFDRDLTTLVVDQRSGEVYAIDSPTDGFDIEFRRLGKGLSTQYKGISIARRESDLGNDRWLEYAVENPIPSQLAYYDYEHIAKVFGGQSSKKADDDLDREQERGLRESEGRDTRGSRDTKSDLSFEDIHKMTYDELCAVIQEENLDIDPKDSTTDAELADWVCEDLKITKSTGRAERERESSKDDDDDPRGRLRNMRRDRE